MVMARQQLVVVERDHRVITVVSVLALMVVVTQALVVAVQVVSVEIHPLRVVVPAEQAEQVFYPLSVVPQNTML